MARLPRLVLAGHAHCIVQRGHGDRTVFADAEDRSTYLQVLHEAAAQERVQIHAWALLGHEALLMATPPEAAALGRMVQALGRRYVNAYNRRHSRSGTLWDGRFRCGVVEPGAMRLAALRWIDGQSREPGLTSAGQRLGSARDPWLIDPPEVWNLGNTPFEREAAYGGLLAERQPEILVAQIRKAALGGWVAGSPPFAAQVALLVQRPAEPRPRGRPKREN